MENEAQVTSTEERTFTQAELNAIVQKRIGEVSAKYENYEELKEKAQLYDQQEEASKSELQKASERAEKLQAELDSMKKAAETRALCDKVAKETGVPAELLRGSTEEELKAHAEAIKAFNKKPAYPSVEDHGEVHPASGGVGGATRDQFKDWFENQM